MKRANYITPEIEVLEIKYSENLLGDFSLSNETPEPGTTLDESRKRRGDYFDDED